MWYNKSMDEKFKQTTYLFKQQTMLLEFAENKLGLKPYASAMDRAGHYILLTLEKNGDFRKSKTSIASIHAYTLGKHKDDSVDFVQVGKIYFTKFHDYHIEIHTLYTDLKYKGNGIGKILLQAAENFAIENNVCCLELHTLLNKTRLKSAEFPKREDFDSFEEYERAVRNELPLKEEKYFDKNYYFYYCQGFTPTSLTSPSEGHKNTIPMAKTLLKFRPLTKSACNKLRDCQPTDKRFQITELHRIHSAGPDSSIFTEKEIDPKKIDVKPFIIKPTQESFDNIKNILNQNIEDNLEN